MGDPYPTHLNIEIDRDRLRSYLRAWWLSIWILGVVGYGGFFAAIFAVDAGTKHGLTGLPAILLGLKHFTEALAGLFLLAIACYFLFSHWRAGRLAETLQVTVEDSFLRIRQQVLTMSDRKLHFRAIVDYTTTQNFLMRRYGLYSLHMTTIGGGPRNTVTIPGIKDALHMRDTLADIDRLRENT